MTELQSRTLMNMLKWQYILNTKTDPEYYAIRIRQAGLINAFLGRIANTIMNKQVAL